MMGALVPSAVPPHNEAHGLILIAKRLRDIKLCAHGILTNANWSKAIDIRDMVEDAERELDVIEQGLVEDVKKQVAACKGCPICPGDL